MCQYTSSTDGTLGKSGYLRWVDQNGCWLKFKTLFAIVGGKDSETSDDKSHINSIWIYNPNDVPLKVKYLMFA